MFITSFPIHFITQTISRFLGRLDNIVVKNIFITTITSRFFPFIDNH